jgi:hypothetical protein
MGVTFSSLAPRPTVLLYISDKRPQPGSLDHFHLTPSNLTTPQPSSLAYLKGPTIRLVTLTFGAHFPPFSLGFWLPQEMGQGNKSPYLRGQRGGDL